GLSRNITGKWCNLQYRSPLAVTTNTLMASLYQASTPFVNGRLIGQSGNVTDFQEFINPEDEDAEEEDTEVNLQEIVDYYTRKPRVEQALEEDDQSESVPTIYEALAVVQRL